MWRILLTESQLVSAWLSFRFYCSVLIQPFRLFDSLSRPFQDPLEIASRMTSNHWFARCVTKRIGRFQQLAGKNYLAYGTAQAEKVSVIRSATSSCARILNELRVSSGGGPCCRS